MCDEIPHIYDLFEILSDDEDWQIIGETYDQVISIMQALIKELLEKFPTKESNIPDIPLFIISCLVRTHRIINSITLLLIYNKCQEAKMLERPLIENILQTKIFLDGKRAKLMRKIKLYFLINEEILYAKELNNINKYQTIGDTIITSKALFERNKSLEEKLKNGLIGYGKEEIDKMRDKIYKGISWYGDHIKKYLKEYQMEDYISDYDFACMLLHVRDENPFYYCKDDECKSQYIFIINKLLKHILDFEKICQFNFSENEVRNKIKKYEKILHEIQVKLAKKLDPDVFEIITLTPSDGI